MREAKGKRRKACLANKLPHDGISMCGIGRWLADWGLWEQRRSDVCLGIVGANERDDVVATLATRNCYYALNK